MELSLGLFFGNQGQIGQPLSEEISLLKCSSRSKQKILGLLACLKVSECNKIGKFAPNFGPAARSPSSDHLQSKTFFS